MTAQKSARPRVSVDGKFFRLGTTRFTVKGVSYGPFAPDDNGQPFPAREQTLSDFRQIRHLGATVVRLYDVPPRWLLELAEGEGLRLLVGIPWNLHHCFLDAPTDRRQALDTIRQGVAACNRHSAVFAYCVANEIPADVVRWTGARNVERLLDEMAEIVHEIDPDGLCTFANFPPTEFLRPQAMDFSCFNVYLHEPGPFTSYLARLQMAADTKPLILGEFGIDTLREGESRQSEVLHWSIERAFRAGLAGAVVFSFTDEWHRGGQLVEDWKMGLTTARRDPRPAFESVRAAFAQAPRFRLPRTPRVSVVVASYNSARTLNSCLESLEQQTYPDYEVILVDDGSTDDTAKRVQSRPDGTNPFPHLRVLRHEHNAGLSVARNTGLAAAEGEIIAFTDADCRADEDWLWFLVSTLVEGDFAAVGGPNLLPPDDSAVASAVMASPGGPAHVMLNDREAEHIPGCNMAFRRDALLGIDGFDPVFTRAGDDVDLCWRLQQAGFRIGFNPAALVWHYRRSTVLAYLQQQAGYGNAEALLVRNHPEYFNSFGGSLWRGRIYSASKLGVLTQPSIIYRGIFGGGGFQTLYTSKPEGALMLCTSLEYYILVSLPLWVLSAIWHGLLPLAAASLLLPLTLCAVAGAQATVPPRKRRWWSRPLIACLFLLQPVVRNAARYRGRFTLPSTAGHTGESLDSLALLNSGASLHNTGYWSETALDRIAFVKELISQLDRDQWPNKSDIGWSTFDVELFGSRWSSVQLTTVAETHQGGKTLLRCKLEPKWSLAAHAGFWALLVVELLLIGLFVEWRPWSPAMLLTLPLFAWFIRSRQRELQSRCIALLDTLARDRGWTKVNENKPETRMEAPKPEARKPETEPATTNERGAIQA